jgi:hypothetical protein
MITHQSIGYSGRLGNQMFQYATLKAISLETGFPCFLPDNTKVKLDGLFDMTNNKWISYKLDLFDGFEITTPILNVQTNSTYQEKEFTFEPEIFGISNNTTIEGYFQSYKYFDKYKDVILNEFTFKKEILYKNFNTISKYTNPVSVHIRRGDYINHPGYWTITSEYIQEALSQFTDNEYTFLIFSDDIEWCKKIFPEGVIFIEGNTAFEDLCLMSMCKHNIIANSSYSWWGAYLNKNEGKRVIAPKNWFIPSKPLIDLYPSNWTII